jgi:hypothetical protein
MGGASSSSVAAVGGAGEGLVTARTTLRKAYVQHCNPDGSFDVCDRQVRSRHLSPVICHLQGMGSLPLSPVTWHKAHVQHSATVRCALVICHLSPVT